MNLEVELFHQHCHTIHGLDNFSASTKKSYSKIIVFLSAYVVQVHGPLLLVLWLLSVQAAWWFIRAKCLNAE